MGVNEFQLQRYNKFITSRPNRPFVINSGLCKHHIFPKCLGGTNEKSNIIILTNREHYIAHLILWKTYGQKLAFAFHTLSYTQGRKLSSRQYENLRADFARLLNTQEIREKRAEGQKLYFSDPQARHRFIETTHSPKANEKRAQYASAYAQTTKGKEFIAHRTKVLKELVWVRNLITQEKRRIIPSLLEEFLSEGWQRGNGATNSSKLGRKWIHKVDQRRQVAEDSLIDYLTDGWALGKGRTKQW